MNLKVLYAPKAVGTTVSALLLTAGHLLASAQQGGTPAPPNTSPHRAFLNQYCVTCHNERLRTADLALDRVDAENIAAGPEVWEKVVRKLRIRAMPPVGAPKPNEATYSSFIAYVEGGLDRWAEENPNPGRPVIHRLNRAEYTNAVRDLLAVEIDATSLLPADEATQGFDNIAEVLSVSPLLMEKYLSAARTISRLAVGDPAAPPVAHTYAVSPNLFQDDRTSEDLPFGSRGGLAVRHNFPLDGEYVVRIRLQRNEDGFIRGVQESHQLDLRLDGDRVKLFTVGGEHRGKSGPLYSVDLAQYRGEAEQVGYEYTADEELEVRFPAKGGAHLIGVAFLRKTSSAKEGVLRPRPMVPDITKNKGGEPAVESFTIVGPYEQTGVGDTPSRRKIFLCAPEAGSAAEPCARRILSSLARRAYRRPVAQDEVEDLLGLYQLGLKSGGPDVGIQRALQRILAGPEFLFRVEEEPAGAQPNTIYRLSDLDLASRLSFFLWSSIPDDELLDLAEKGRLAEPAVLEQQVRRMLSDSRSKSLVANFAGQWLYLRNVAKTSPDPRLFPEFDDNLRQAFRRETEMLFESALREDRPVVELLTAGYTFLNERLARHYGIPGVYGSHFRKVELPEETRRGLLGQAAILTVTSYGNRTSPVLRGKWVLENLLGTPPPPPPPDVVATLKDENTSEGRPLSLREQMEKHRANPACSSCHKLMDPIGFALENFDAIGRWRNADNGNPIDVSGVLFDGGRIDSAADFRRLLLTHKDQFLHTLTGKLLTFALGRELGYEDAAAIRRIVREAGANDYRWSSIISGIVRSVPFQMRRSRES